MFHVTTTAPSCTRLSPRCVAIAYQIRRRPSWDRDHVSLGSTGPREGAEGRAALCSRGRTVGKVMVRDGEICVRRSGAGRPKSESKTKRE